MAYSGQQQQPPTSSTAATKPEEFVVRVPVCPEKKKYSVLKFSGSLGIDITQWNQVNLVREDNARVFVDHSSGEPKFGAGSEFGKGAREEARRKKLGFRSRKYRTDDQPWLLTLPGKQERKFRGQREGGVAQNADYWIFVKAGEGLFDAYPVSDWYSFMPISRYKTLGIDEAEEQFLKRNQVVNQFALKRLIKPENGDEDGAKNDEGRAGSGRKKKDDDDIEDVAPTKGVGKGKGKGKTKPKKKPKKKAFNDDDDEPMASADSDDGDGEGRELDYMSSSESSSSDEELELKLNDRGVDEEVGMRQLIASDEEEEEEKQNEEEQKTDFTKVENMPTSGFDDEEEKESDSGSDSDDPDKEDIKSAALIFMPQKQSADGASTSATASSATGPGSSDSGLKRKLQQGESSEHPAPKKHKPEKESKTKSDKPMSMEDEVRRYLQRRALSTTDLVTKFKRNCQGMAKQEIVQQLADILKRLKPRQERRNGVLYFSLTK